MMIILKKLAIFLPILLLLYPFLVVADDDPAISCLTKNIYFEAKNQSVAGQMAVALVVMNRVKDSRYPSTVCEVIHEGPHYESWKTKAIPNLPEKSRKYYPRRDRCQFSWYCDGKSDKPKELSAIDTARWVAWMILNGHVFDFTRGSTHYHAHYVTPTWSKDPDVTKIMQLDDHIFYVWK